MKRIATALCALAVVMAGSVPALAAEEAPRQDASYYPISVEEYTYGVLDELRVKKVYQLSLSDDPSLIPTGDFERNGLWFTLLDMTRKNEVGVDTQPYTETVTRPSKTNDMAQVLQALEAEMEVTTSEGYAGTLHLDHTSVQVKTDGYATRTNNLSATRSYPNLSDADVSLVPKSIEDKGKTLTLADVQWSEAQYADGAGGTVTRYEDARGQFELANGHTLLRYLTAAHFGAVSWEVVPGTTYERAILREVDTSTPEYQAFARQLYAKALERMGLGKPAPQPEKQKVRKDQGDAR